MRIHEVIFGPGRAGSLAPCAALGLLALACATVEPPPPATAAGPPSLPSPPPATARHVNVGLTADLDRCQTSPPHFFYDVDMPRPQDQAELLALANCLQSEPYRQLNLMLVGRADHRGGDAYNDDLAQRRAQQVADLLASHGVSRARLVVLSRGEAEAIGHEHPLASMGYDRRVDILVMNPVTPGHPARPAPAPTAR